MFVLSFATMSCYLVRQNRKNLQSIFKFYSTKFNKKICVVGSGPAGFYTAQHILKNEENTSIDMFEKLPTPFGLVRYGVAPDHQEVKNVINTFKKVAEHPRFRYYGNINVGTDITLTSLREHYHVVILAYGSSSEKKLNLPNEDASNVFSARDFVAWYNGHPGFESFNPILGEKVTIIGQGNVAIDVARILLKSPEALKCTDITENALKYLKNHEVKEVSLVGRRGPLEVAFSIKELREVLKIPQVVTCWRKNDFASIATETLPRPRKRLTELMLKSVTEQNENEENEKSLKCFKPIFFRAPTSLHKSDSSNLVHSISFAVNEVENGNIKSTNLSEEIQTDSVCKSIGYQASIIDESLDLDKSLGYLKNENGRVKNSYSGEIVKGLYVTGWLRTGPTGVLLSTMNSSFSLGEIVCKDIRSGFIDLTKNCSGIDIGHLTVVTWSQWEKIDQLEIKRGQRSGKPREKLLDIKEMLQAAFS